MQNAKSQAGEEAHKNRLLFYPPRKFVKWTEVDGKVNRIYGRNFQVELENYAHFLYDANEKAFLMDK